MKAPLENAGIREEDKARLWQIGMCPLCGKIEPVVHLSGSEGYYCKNLPYRADTHFVLYFATELPF
jgi:hypothetical protein